MSNLMNFNSVLGKMILIILIIVATHFHILAGILILLVVVSMKQHLFEGMENNDNTKNSMTDQQANGITTESIKPHDMVDKNSDMDTDTDNENENDNNSSISLFKKNNCKNGILMKNGKRVTSDLIKESFPNVKFTKEQCNPCDDDCEFEIVSSVEQITNEENLRPQDSNTQPVDRERVTKKQ